MPSYHSHIHRPYPRDRSVPPRIKFLKQKQLEFSLAFYRFISLLCLYLLHLGSASCKYQEARSVKRATTESLQYYLLLLSILLLYGVSRNSFRFVSYSFLIIHLIIYSFPPTSTPTSPSPSPSPSPPISIPIPISISIPDIPNFYE
ncbi:hypothetical protein EYC80_008859 [Monilinia laxa]|uniref:Uncharacterized protein n=1 Tax=Monilinia laxa TaxID=61186 RepID=A0A5N6K1R4_MONLA|nr:hypothetical protein EYC80_008859 [Monilinia laxa]